MATAMAAIYDPVARRLTFALAGHLPPLVAPLDGSARVRGRRARAAAGRGRDRLRAPRRSTCPTGATVVLYTDGLIEDRSRSIDVGLEQLRAAR